MMSSSGEPATAAAQRPAIELSVDDYAQHVLLPRFLRLFEDALNRPLQARLLEEFNPIKSAEFFVLFIVAPYTLPRFSEEIIAPFHT